MDALDLGIVKHLMRDGRATWADLAVELGLTAPAIAQRVRRLQDRGIIRQFGAWLAPDRLVPVSAFVGVTLGSADAHPVFQREVHQLDVIQECHQLLGADDYLLKVRCASLPQLADLVSRVLPSLAGGGRAHSTVILSTIKESPILPLPDLPPDA